MFPLILGMGLIGAIWLSHQHSVTKTGVPNTSAPPTTQATPQTANINAQGLPEATGAANPSQPDEGTNGDDGDIEIDQPGMSDGDQTTSAGGGGMRVTSFGDAGGTVISDAGGGSAGGPGTTAGAGDGFETAPNPEPQVDASPIDLMDAVHGDSSGMTDQDVADTYSRMAGPTGLMF